MRFAKYDEKLITLLCKVFAIKWSQHNISRLPTIHDSVDNIRAIRIAGGG